MKHFLLFLSFVVLSQLQAVDSGLLDELSELDYRKNGSGLKSRIMESMRGDGFDADWEPALLKIIEDEDATLDARRLSCELLKLVATAESIEPLLAHLTDSRLATEVQIILATVDYPRVNDALIASLKSAAGNQSIGVMEVMASKRDRSFVPALIDLSKDQVNFDVFSKALTLIGYLGGPEAESFFTQPEILKEESSMLRGLYSEAIVQLFNSTELSDRSLKQFIRFLKKGDDAVSVYQAAKFSLRLDPQNLDVVLDLLSSASDEERRIAGSLLPLLQLNEKTLKTLSKQFPELPDESKVLLLRGMATQGVWEVLPIARNASASDVDHADLTAAIYEVIGAFGDLSDMKRLLPIAVSDREDQEYAEIALGKISDAEVDDWLIEEFSKVDDYVKTMIVQIVADRGLFEEITKFSSNLDQVSPEVQNAIYKALGQLGNYDSAKMLMTRWDRVGGKERKGIERAVVEIGRRSSTDEITQVLISKHSEVTDPAQTQIRRMIGAIGDDASLAFLQSYLDGEYIDQVALRSLLVWRDSSGFQVMEKLLTREDLEDKTKIQIWNSMLRLTKNALKDWEKQRIEMMDTLIEKAPSKAVVSRLIGGLDEFARGEVLTWLEKGLEHPDYQGEFKIAYDRMNKDMNL